MELLTPVYGVGTLIALTYILTLEDAQRFAHSRDVGPFLGLQPKQRGKRAKPAPTGDQKNGGRIDAKPVGARGALHPAARGRRRRFTRFGDAASWSGGGKNAKRRTVVAVARKLAVLLHTLWANGQVYDPLYNRKAIQAAQAKAKGKRQNCGIATAWGRG